ncbi:MAG: hypothetical protein QOH25_1105 [Acidobacteriota bacterium]|jgi:PIN domain nuclease of toxin-antitoxin system|nr:hypothetical protein [Acidobacteriota bacterium]
MKLLLDTHIFIWWANEPERLSQTFLSALTDESNTLFLSIVSAWEMQVKMQLGKLKLNLPLQELIQSQQEANALQLLPIELEHVLALSTLPSHHKDPFDRLLIAQAIVEEAMIVSADSKLSAYSVKLL